VGLSVAGRLPTPTFLNASTTLQQNSK
jgi:hypothetical protein